MRPRMTTVRTRIRIAADGTLTGQVAGLRAGEHEAEILLLDTAARLVRLDPDALLARLHIIQAEVAQLPALDSRSPDEILGYNERGHFN